MGASNAIPLEPSRLIFRADYAGWADKIQGESFNTEDGVYKLIQHEPLGVCAGIASWNAGFLYAGWKIAPAVATGNAVCHSDPS
jgi:acyl-CoA reductase-like NAD-dependent aldehyde dehydrogenase